MCITGLRRPAPSSSLSAPAKVTTGRRATVGMQQCCPRKQKSSWSSGSTISARRGCQFPVNARVPSARDLSVPRDSFSASWCWQKRFLDKHHLSLRRKTRIGQKTPEDSQQAAAAFGVAVLEAIIKHNIVAVYNADQTAVSYEYLPSHTISEKGERIVWVRNSGVEKSHMTVTLLADSNGNKRVPFVILKQRPSAVPETRAINHERQRGFGRGVWAEVSRLMEQTGIQIYSNSKGWWICSLSVLFLKFNFGGRANISKNILLMWDDFSGHWTQEVCDCADNINVVLLKIPAGYTSVCQPVDMTWMKPLKQRLCTKWVSAMEERLRAHRRSDTPASFKLLAPKRQTVMDWLHSSCAELSIGTISSGFKKFLIASRADEVLCQEESVPKGNVVDLVAALTELNSAQDVGCDSEDSDNNEE